MQRAVRIGITGKMGSGKSTLSRMLSAEGFVTVTTDDVAKQLMVEDSDVRNRITGLLGDAAYEGGQLNRGFVAQQIFHDRDKRLALEAIVHPAVTEAMEEVFEASSGKSVAVESALILQTELWLHFDYIVLVDAADDIVVARLLSKGRFAETDIRQRLLEQHYDQIQREEADFVLENNGSEKEFGERARSIVMILKLLAQRELPDAPLHSIFEEEGEEDQHTPGKSEVRSGKDGDSKGPSSTRSGKPRPS